MQHEHEKYEFFYGVNTLDEIMNGDHYQAVLNGAKLTNRERLDIAVQIQRNQILATGFGLNNDPDRVPPIEVMTDVLSRALTIGTEDTDIQPLEKICIELAEIKSTLNNTAQ